VLCSGGRRADKERIEREIKTMPDYFADYDTIVHFISLEELKEKHSGIPHGGFSIRRVEQASIMKTNILLSIV